MNCRFSWCTNMSKWNIIIDFEEAESYKKSSNAQTIEEVITEASKNNYIKEHLYEITNMCAIALILLFRLKCIFLMAL